MSTPIIETIATKIEALINTITETNGFNQDLVAVRPKRIHLEGDVNDDLNVFIYQEDKKLAEDSTTSIVWLQEFSLQAMVIDSDEATASIDTRLNQVGSDIEKKLMEDNHWELDGLGRVMLLGTERFSIVDRAQLSGIAVNIGVLYEVDSDNPYSQT